MKATIMRASFRLVVSAATLTLAAWGCTVSKPDNPPPTGPSELALSLSVLASPDTLSQDGASQSQIIFNARDANGRPVSGLVIRTDIVVGGIIQDFGSLSAKTVVTGGDGRATAIYTAPSAVSGGEASSTVVIRGTPVSTDASATVPRTVTIRLLAPGVITPPGPTPPDFTMSPSDPDQLEFVTFNASAAGSDIVEWDWDFGDGSTASGSIVQHAYDDSGSFTVTLTVTDGFGLSASRPKTINVAQGTEPEADFVFSPTTPTPGDTVFFNASTSTPAPGRSIVSYIWNFGTSTGTASGKIVTKVFTAPGTYTVTLTVRDDAGVTATTSKEVTVEP
jgi:PKD repeat protein